jgi:LysR family transcriptional regulator, glycine cleavage system transcriptional activator
MSDWIPSLNALRAFEAVCRHKNYARAADELYVTPAAVKQLVHKLEQAVGHKLVERSGRGVSITAPGLAGMESLTSGFAFIETAVERMRKHSDRQRLIVSVEPSFATAWLVPRLERFRAHNADVDVLIDSSLKLADLAKGEADIAIRFGSEPAPGLLVKRLFDEQLCAFCSPALMRGPQPLRHVQDLERAALLHWDVSELGWATVTRRWMTWQGWLREAGASAVDWKNGVRFSDYNLAVQAAVAGQGVVIGSLPVLHDLIEAGLLVNPFSESVDPEIGYDLVTEHEALVRPAVQHFADWIVAEAEHQRLPRSKGST